MATRRRSSSPRFSLRRIDTGKAPGRGEASAVDIESARPADEPVIHDRTIRERCWLGVDEGRRFHSAEELTEPLAVDNLRCSSEECWWVATAETFPPVRTVRLLSRGQPPE